MLLYLFEKVTVAGDDKDKSFQCGDSGKFLEKSVKSLFVENQ